MLVLNLNLESIVRPQVRDGSFYGLLLTFYKSFHKSFHARL